MTHLPRLMPIFLFGALLAAATPAQSLCGDCDGNGVVNVLDAFEGARHTVQLISLTATNFQACNVFGDPGPPTAPGNPVVNVLDAFTVAQFSAGLLAMLNCSMAPVLSPGPYDLRFGGVPAQTVSDRPFELSVFLYDQGTMQPVIPTSPLLVSLTVETGSGTLLGSTRQWVTTDSMVFGNLIYGPVETYSLRCSAGPPHGDDVSSTIDNLLSVETDKRGDVVVGAGPYSDVRFHFRAAGMSVSVATGTFDWRVEQVSSGMVMTSGNIPLTGQTFVDVPVTSLPATGLYEIHGEIAGTPASDVFPRMRASTSTLESRPTLASGRVDMPYSANITDYIGQAVGAPGYTPPTFGPYASWEVLASELPPGLTMSAGGAGTIAGTPARPGFYPFTAYGVTAAGDVTRCAVNISIFSWRDTEVQTGIDFSAMGPYTIAEFDSSYNFTNWWDCTTDSTMARFYFPANADQMRRLPAMTFIHGNGFRYDYYDEQFRIVASYGYLIGSVDNPGYPQQGCLFCSTGGGGGPGYSRATGFQDSIIDKFYELDAGTLPGAPPSAMALVDHVDFDNLFYSGHSRGGSTTQLNQIWKPFVVRGAIPSMQVDTVQQGCLGSFFVFPPLPTLSFFAERDGDVDFPLAEASIEDKELYGMTTGVTIYGTCHAYFCDTGTCFSTPIQTRQRTQEIGRHWYTTFLQRHARGDLRLEGQLYGGEHQSSNEVGVFGDRDMNSVVEIDNHQATGPATNQTGGPNSAVTIAISETNTYPNGYGRTIVHRRFGFAAGNGTNTWSAPPGSPVDTADRTGIVFRLRQYDCVSTGCTGTSNWDWITTWSVTLEDGAGAQSTVDMLATKPPSTGLSNHQRFGNFQVPFTDFVAANPAFDPSSIQLVRFNIGPTATAGADFVAADDVRFE